MNTHTERKGGKAGRPARRLCAALLCLCLLAGLAPNMGTTAFAAGDYKIGDTVNFAGYEWYIIGTPTEGVTAPAGCYTLFAKDNDFDSTVFRPSSASGDDQVKYNGSELQNKILEIAEGFSEEDKSSIQTRDLTVADDNIYGLNAYDQLLWPISAEEGEKLDQSIKSFNADYWTRQNYGTFNVYLFYATGRRSFSACYNTYAIRPALYVKQEAIAPDGDFLVGSDAIENAQMGVNFVQSTGTDTPLIIDDSLKLDVRVEASETQQRNSVLHFRLYGNSTTTGSNLVVACVLTDADGTVKYYGKFMDCSDALPETSDLRVSMGYIAYGTYTLSIFLHDTATNRISNPSPTMTVEIGGGFGTISNYNGQTYVDAPVFTQHPQNQITYTGSTASFSAEADGMGITYTWQAQPKTSDPDTGAWYDIYYYVPSGVSLPYRGQSLYLPNVSGTWQDNEKVLRDSSGVSFDPADARFRCVATNYADISTNSNPAELTVISGGGGTDGREVELRTNDTHVQWKYKGEADTEWRDLVALSAITGEAGADGREIQFQVANGYIQWKYDTDPDTAWQDLIALSDLKGQDGEDGREIELRNNGAAIQWRYEGEADSEWKDLVTLSAITGSDGQDGADGREVQLRTSGGYIQWKYSTEPDTAWQNLIAVSALQGMKGDKGDKGDTGAAGQNGTAGQNGADGQDGVGIASLSINESGQLVVALTDGTTHNLGQVRGQDGVGVASAYIDAQGQLIITLTDGTQLNAGAVGTSAGAGEGPWWLVYLALGLAGASLAGLAGVLCLLYAKRRVLFGPKTAHMR